MAHPGYVQLSRRERDRIAHLRAQGVSLREVAKQLGRNVSTISRELSRNGSQVYVAYGACSADQRARVRKRRAGRRPRLKSARLRAYVHQHLRMGWSPEQIAGKLATSNNGLKISPEAIYQYVYEPKVRRKHNLVPCLARAHQRRQLKGHRHTHRQLHIPQRVSIKRRPRVINERKQYGHWERDGVENHQSKNGLNVLVERKTGFVKVTKVSGQTARNTSTAMTRTLSRYPSAMRRSVTYDNGKENAEHVRVNKILGTKSYFCEPYHSWEKGTVENTIGLIRRFFPKSTNFERISVKQVKAVERKLNNRPRKRLKYLTPRQVFLRGVALTH